MRIISTSLVACAVAALAADESIVNDVRLGIAYGVAQEAHYDVDPVSGDVDAEPLRISLGYVRGFAPFAERGAALFGVHVFRETSDGEGEGSLTGVEPDTETLGLLIEGGYGIAIPALPALSLEGAFQLGYLHQNVAIDAGADYDVGQTGFEYALRVSAEYALSAQWLVGFDVRWLLDAHTEGMVNDRTSTYENDGLSLGVNVGYRL